VGSVDARVINRKLDMDQYCIDSASFVQISGHVVVGLVSQWTEEAAIYGVGDTALWDLRPR